MGAMRVLHRQPGRQYSWHRGGNATALAEATAASQRTCCMRKQKCQMQLGRRCIPVGTVMVIGILHGRGQASSTFM